MSHTIRVRTPLTDGKMIVAYADEQELMASLLSRGTLFRGVQYDIEWLNPLHFVVTNPVDGALAAECLLPESSLKFH